MNESEFHRQRERAAYRDAVKLHADDDGTIPAQRLASMVQGAARKFDVTPAVRRQRIRALASEGQLELVPDGVDVRYRWKGGPTTSDG